MKNIEQAVQRRIITLAGGISIKDFRETFGKETYQDTPDNLEIVWSDLNTSYIKKLPLLLKGLEFKPTSSVKGYTGGDIGTYINPKDNWAAFVNKDNLLIADLSGARKETASIETADDADLFPQGVKIGAGQLRLADKIVEAVGIEEGMKHNLLVGMIAYILVHPDYTKEAGFDLAAFKAAFRKVAPKLDQVLSPLQEQFE